MFPSLLLRGSPALTITAGHNGGLKAFCAVWTCWAPENMRVWMDNSPSTLQLPLNRSRYLKLWLKSLWAHEAKPRDQQVFCSLVASRVDVGLNSFRLANATFTAIAWGSFVMCLNFCLAIRRAWSLTFHPVNHLAGAPLAHRLHDQCHGRSLSFHVWHKENTPSASTKNKKTVNSTALTSSLSGLGVNK